MNDDSANSTPKDPTQAARSNDNPALPLFDFDSNLSSHTVRVGNYQLKRVIGSGGMGAVYEALQDSPRRIVALKLMRNPLGSPSNLRRFQYESQLLARLRHPGIAEVYEAGTYVRGETSIPFYTMEFVPGAKNIADYVRENILGARQVIELYLKVCDAMQHAHGRGVIHRDLKPPNVLVDASGQPKIIDFGIARALDADQVPATLQTRADQLLGTLQYMSPEQLDGDPSALDARSDVYSMGVILYELLCGRLPYDVSASRLHEASRLIREHPPTSPRVIKPDLSRDIETVLLKALQKDRLRRYQSAQDLGDDLRRILDDLPIAARSDSAAYLLRTRVRRAATHNRIVFNILAILAAFFVAETVGVALGGAGLNNAYERFITTYLASTPQRLRNVIVIGMQDDTDWKALAAEVGAGQVDPIDVRTMRRIHAALLRKMIGVDARALAFDIIFSKEAPGIDEELAAAARALREDGTAVVCAAPSWRIREDGTPEIVPALARECRWGSLLAHLSRGEPWSIDLYLKPASRPIMPSLALAAVAAYWNPTLIPSFESNGGWNMAIVHFSSPTATATSAALAPVAPDQTIRLMRMRLMDINRPDQGINPADLSGQYLIQMPSTETLQHSTLDYAAVLRMSLEDRRAALGGKLVLVGDLRAGHDGPFELPDGRKLAGVYAHAAAADAIIAKLGDAPRLPGYVLIGRLYVHGRYLLDVAAALIGATVAWIYWNHPVKRSVCLLTLALIVLAFSTTAFELQRLVIEPWVALLALPLATELVALVERVAGRPGAAGALSQLTGRRSE